MVLIKTNRLKEIYNQLISNSGTWKCSTLILVANEIDAICSAKILKTLFENDSLTFQIEPISGYQDVHVIREKYLSPGHSFRSVILINCGGLVDLRAEWEPVEGFDIYLFDCMRPLNLSNVYGCMRINVIAEKDKHLGPQLKDAFETYEFGEPTLDHTRAINDDEFIDQFKSDKEHFERSARMVENYGVQGSSYVTATALTMFHLAQALNQVTNDILWLAILGVTHHYSLERFDDKIYAEMVQELREELNKLKIKSAPSASDFKAPQGAFAKRLASKRTNPYALPFSARSAHSFLQGRSSQSTSSIESSQESSSKSTSNESSSSATTQRLAKGSINFHEELKLPHYRHWTLYESLFHSTYACARLGLWSESGRRKLRNLLAKMGIPLSEATQNYSYMKLSLKKNLKSQFKQNAPLYGLPDLTYDSFVRSYGNEFESPLSAAEAVASMSALLKMTPFGLSTLLSQPISSPRDLDAQLPMINIPTTDHTNIHILMNVLKHSTTSGAKLNEEDYEDWWKTCFWACYDSLSDVSLARAGVDLSIYFHKLIVSQAFSLIQRQEIRTVKQFRLIVIKDGALLPLFHHHHTLYLLGQFLLNALQLNGQNSLGSNHYPLVISSLDESREVFNVLGLVPSSTYRYQSPLGWVFLETINQTQARVKVDHFDPSFLQIKSEDLVNFIHKIQLPLHT